MNWKSLSAAAVGVCGAVVVIVGAAFAMHQDLKGDIRAQGIRTDSAIKSANDQTNTLVAAINARVDYVVMTKASGK